MPKNIKKIVKVADLRRSDQPSNRYGYDGSRSISCPVINIYDIGEFDDEDGYIKFADGRGWFVGCVEGFYVEFDDGSCYEFHGFHDAYGSKDPGMISEAIAMLRRIVFGFDNEEDDPDTNMPDIF